MSERLPHDLERLVKTELLRKPDDLTVACYTCPLWHASTLFERQYGPGWTEYVLMRGARPWFPGHHQPRQPLLGELDERRPETWERYNELAAEHGIDVFIWDWYWYDDEPAMHEALEEGFLRARNRGTVKFALMWTNHPWLTLFPTVHGDGTRSFPHARDAPSRPEDVWRSMSYLIARYLHHPDYWRIDAKPVVVIWDTRRLVATLGVDGTRRLLDDMRAFAAKLGHDGIHFHNDCTQAVADGSGVGALAALGFDSYGLYNPVVLAGLRRPNEEELPAYGVAAADVVRDVWPEVDALAQLPCFPAVSPGWDAAPRHNQLPRSTEGDRASWPGALLVVNETPGAFDALVRAAFAYLNERPQMPRVLTVGCWNEWTEGQYILPDTRLGYGMLKALARALGVEREQRSYASPGADPWPGEAGPGPRLDP
jgi:glycosyl transferase family WbsX